MANCEFCKLQDNCPGLNLCVHESRDALRYQWLRSCRGLDLRSDHVVCTRWDGTNYMSSHCLVEGGTQHALAPTLDETIDAAMQEQAQRGK